MKKNTFSGLIEADLGVGACAGQENPGERDSH
jgi:hypothetical protein